MKAWVLDALRCPNLRTSRLRPFVTEVIRNGRTISSGRAEDQLNPDDTIVTGLLMNETATAVYPIEHGIAVLLSDEDVDTSAQSAALARQQAKCPADWRAAIAQTTDRFNHRNQTREGMWNREEMHYYDHRDEVIPAPPAQETVPRMNRSDWDRILLRKREILDHVSGEIQGKRVLEVGCGTAKTVASSFNPSQYNYSYVGIDISWQRLLRARSIVKEGSFIQASALNLPFDSKYFHVILAFGALHHVPLPSLAVEECMRVLSPNGRFAFQEPIATRKLIESEVLRRTIERLISYEHSEHDQEIDYDAVKARLLSSRFVLLNEAYHATPVGYILQRLKKALPIVSRSSTAASVLLRFDKALATQLKGRWQRLGPRAVAVVSEHGEAR